MLELALHGIWNMESGICDAGSGRTQRNLGRANREFVYRPANAFGISFRSQEVKS